jgi:tetratricopeptide (TPR) repeat protein
MHLRQGRHIEALEELQTAITALPSDLLLQIKLATVLWRSGQTQAASAVFGAVLSVEPDSAEALAGRGQIRADRGNAAAALADLRALGQIKPNAGQSPEIRSAYALALAHEGREDTAMTEADAAVEAADDSAVIFLRAAHVARAAGALQRATELLRRAEGANHPALSVDERTQVRRLKNQVTGIADPR